MTRYEELLGQQQEVQSDELEIYVPPGPRLGEVVVEAKGLSKAFGENVLFEDVKFNLPRGGIVGVIGPNGAGKTTLFRMIVGKEKPDQGALQIGETVKLGLCGSRPDAGYNKTVWEVISDGQDTLKLGKVEVNSRRIADDSILAGRSNRRKSKICPAANEIGCIWRACSKKGRISCCSTSRPTIWTSTRSGRLKKD